MEVESLYFNELDEEYKKIVRAVERAFGKSPMALWYIRTLNRKVPAWEVRCTLNEKEKQWIVEDWGPYFRVQSGRSWRTIYK